MFRPSDDATVFPFLVPSNFFAVVSLRQAAEMLEQIHHDQETAAQCRALADEVERALREYAVVIHAKFGAVYAYEVDGYGNYYCIDDGNVPSLLSLALYRRGRSRRPALPEHAPAGAVRRATLITATAKRPKARAGRTWA